MSCTHLVGYRCSLGLHGGAPSPGCCALCAEYDGPPRGAGDLVHAAAVATGAEAIISLLGGCSKCLERRIRLNAAVPFPDEHKED